MTTCHCTTNPSEPCSTHAPHTVLPGPLLRSMCAERGLTQAEAARQLGCSEKHLSQVVFGRAPITPSLAVKLTTALGVDGRRLLRAQADLNYTLREHFFGTKEKRTIADHRHTLIRIDEDAIAKQYNTGRSIRQLAAEHHASYGRIHRILSRRPDVTIRERGTGSPPPEQTLVGDDAPRTQDTGRDRP